MKQMLRIKVIATKWLGEGDHLRLEDWSREMSTLGGRKIEDVEGSTGVFIALLRG
jgi:hypothetical protein